ncbi:hypothetical protein [Cereibacter johrii]|uniref:Lipoprotein n=1 Tax=Cereibacter johrii TaxID=445629 RepID=A0ABX5J9I6_9RHOB|nr:hypothetical protein [Cereibacter johrii]QCP86742.1 hypothetical protein EYE35_13925 [Cereibacter sphaeroides]RDS93851.1 hypothetical protein DWF04_22125 [Cereibacter sphaeroides f. sp. denitrificans]ODM42194.1 hypothetical protein A9O63_00175 [Cereibacter johrii]PTM79454.1 hypothetical protein C8J29_103556 [Cereibacter johrii]RAZ86131.1 hypothetical protein DDV93_06905 [Cereibacter johrii]
MRALPALPLLFLLAACGPMSVQRAEEVCFERARLAEAPRGTIGVGAGKGGMVSDLELTVTSDYLMGRDPSALFDACVYQKSGQPPTRPFYSR